MKLTLTNMDHIVIQHMWDMCCEHNNRCDNLQFRTPGQWLYSIGKVEAAANAYREFGYHTEWEYVENTNPADCNDKITDLTIRRERDTWGTIQIYPPVLKEEKK